jgi:hypothetical protein
VGWWGSQGRPIGAIFSFFRNFPVRPIAAAGIDLSRGGDQVGPRRRDRGGADQRWDEEIAGEIAVDRRWVESAFAAVCVARFSLSRSDRRCCRIDVDSSDVKIVSQTGRGGPCGPPPRVRCLAGGLAVWSRRRKAWRKSLPHRTILNAMIPMVLKSEVTEFRCF